MRSMMDQVNLNLLKTFAVVAEEKNFRAAAERLHLSQSAVSAHVKLLESQVGIRLFRRTTRNVQLTVEGEQLLAGSLPALHAIDGVLQTVRAVNPLNSGQVTFACMRAVASSYVVPAMSLYRKDFPNVKLRVREIPSREIYRHLKEGKAEFGVGAHSDESGVTFSPIMEEPFVALVPRSLIPEDKTSLTLPELAKLPILLYNSMTLVRRRLQRAFLEHGWELKAHHECEQTATLISLAENGYGAAVMAYPSVRNYRSSLAQVLPIDFPTLTMVTGIITLEGKTLSPQASRLASVITEVITGMGRRA